MEKELEKIVANLVRKVERRFYGKYRGFVENNEDPEKLGRLLVKVPSVLGDKVAVWAFPCVPYGGMANQGFFFIPEKKAGVWIEFEEGDPEFPIWVGTFWSKPGGKSESPKPNKPDGSEEGDIQKPPTCKIFKTEKGHTIQMEDKTGEEMVTIVEAENKNVITMNKDGIKITDGANTHEVTLNSSGITISDKTGSNEVVMDGNSITIKSSAVKVGSSEAAESLVLGNQLDANVKAFLTALSTHTHTVVIGAPSSTVTSNPPAGAFTLKVPLSTKHKTE